MVIVMYIKLEGINSIKINIEKSNKTFIHKITLLMYI